VPSSQDAATSTSWPPPRGGGEPAALGAAAAIRGRPGPHLSSTALAVAAHVQRRICQVGGLGPVTADGSAHRLAPRVAIRGWRGIQRKSVTWRVLAERGIAVRGPALDQMDIHHDEAELRRWCLQNVDGYWRRWAQLA